MLLSSGPRLGVILPLLEEKEIGWARQFRGPCHPLQ
jgi:hypothetical protein